MSVREKFHRWRWRKQYALLPEFYQDFYPFDMALSLTMQYVRHSLESAQSMDELASKSIGNAVGLEKQVTQLRLALAAARMGWNEDRVDAFMSNWFPRHDRTAP